MMCSQFVGVSVTGCHRGVKKNDVFPIRRPESVDCHRKVKKNDVFPIRRPASCSLSPRREEEVRRAGVGEQDSDE
jgi:hypothetical protein